jgi:hypothetical protein
MIDSDGLTAPLRVSARLAPAGPARHDVIQVGTAQQASGG